MKLHKRLDDAQGFFKRKERREIEEQIRQTERKLEKKEKNLSEMIKAEGYPSIQAFTATYRLVKHGR